MIGFTKPLTLTALLTGMLGLAAASHAANAPAVVESTLDGGRFGAVHIFRPAAAPTNVALLFSGDGGWGGGVAQIARRLAGEGFLVGGVDTTIYIASIAPKKPRTAAREAKRPAPSWPATSRR